MALYNSAADNMYEDLKHKFLFNNDINCIHILLNLYELEENINNISPRYIAMNNIRRNIKRQLKERKGKHLITLNLSQLIHEDINRLELFLYLEGYKAGYFKNQWVNLLEEFTVKYYTVEDLYNINYLFNFHIKRKEIIDLKYSINLEIDEIELKDKTLYKSITKYISYIIKPKVLSLNKFLDKQLAIDYNSNTYNIKEDDTLLTLEDLNSIYMVIVNIVLKDGIKLYKEAFWHGLNDRVLKRYR